MTAHTLSLEAQLDGKRDESHVKETKPEFNGKSSTQDVEAPGLEPRETDGSSAFKALGWLDRLLALWIFLAMAIGIILGNFVPNVGSDLKKGELVGVSVPIGWFFPCSLPLGYLSLTVTS